MSSLTSVGVNKNKKGFAPKLSKRKDRKDRKSTAASTSANAATENLLTTEAAGPSLTEPASTSTSSITDNGVIASSPSTTTKAKIAVKVQSTPTSVEEIISPIDPKIEYLTEEEIAINATAASRKRRRISKEEPEDMPSSPQPHSIKEPSPVREASPSDYTDKPDCNFDKLLLKVESLAPDSKGSLGQVDKEHQQSDQEGNTEEYVRVRKESVAPKVDNNVPKMDVNDDVDYTDLLASGEDDDVDVDGDVPVERLMPVYIDIGQTDPNATPVNTSESSTKPAVRRASARSSKLAASDRLKGTRYISGAEDDDDQYGEEAEESEQPKKKKLKPLKPKGKGKEKERSATKSKSKTSSKSSKKIAGTAISIGIGIPSTSTSTPITPGESASTSAEEEEYSEEDLDGNRVVKTRKKKRNGYKKSYRFDYRLVENMKTLDDITDDPAPAENLEKPMFSFTRDIDGIVSKTFKEMEVLRSEARKKDEARSKMSKEELEALKLKEAAEERIARAKRDAAKAKEEERRRKELDGQVLAESSNALQVRLVNGEIVLDTDSLVVERTEREVNYGDDPIEVVEESSMTRKVNSMTYGKRKQSSRWDEFETALFYDCLSQFGTDFEMIANMMPGRTRSQIRMKFNREERLCPEKVTEYMISKRKPMDLEKYKEMSGIELEAVPDDFHEMQLA